MTTYQTTEALCLHVLDFSETSQIARLFTRDCGLVSVIAKGIKRDKPTASQPLGSTLDSLARGQAVLIHPRRHDSGALATLSGWQVLDHRPPMRRCLSAFYAGALMAEATMALLAPLDPHPALFEEMVAALELACRESPARVAAAYLKVAHKEAGYMPVFDHCVICGALPTTQKLHFAPQCGGIVCDRCPRRGATLLVAGPVVAALDRLRAPRDVRSEGSVRPAQPQALLAALQLLVFHLEYVTDRRLKTRPLLPQLLTLSPPSSAAAGTAVAAERGAVGG